MFSESTFGIHYLDDTQSETFLVFALTFPPKVIESDGRIIFNNNLSGNKEFKSALYEYNKEKKGNRYKTVSILVGFDLDEAGELMSEALREILLGSGVDERDIFRTPLTQSGYIAQKSFGKTEKYKKYLWLQQGFMTKLKTNPVVRAIGFIKAFSLKYTIKRRNTTIGLKGSRINTQGTSTATAVTKIILGDTP